MKKRIAIMLVLLCVAACFCGFAACKNNEPTTLSPPTGLKVNDEEILTWDKVDGASSYLVEIDDKSYETTTNSLDILTYTLEYKTYEIKVTAYGDLNNYLDSKPSKVLEYTVPEVSGLKFKLINDEDAYMITGFDKTQGGKLIIPAEYEGKPVVEVDSLSFCGKLTSVVLPDTIEKIDHTAFSGCVNLKRVKLPYYLRTLGNVVFSGCSSLTQIELPPLIEKIGLGIFQGCDSLTRISMIEDLDYPYKVENNCLIRRQDNALISGCKTSVIPNYVKSLEYAAFDRLKTLKQITIPESVEKIDWCVFQKTGLTQIHIPSGVRSIGRDAFSDCVDLKEVTFSEGVEVIGRERADLDYGDNPGTAFSNCKRLKSIFFPASLKRVDGSTFLGCSNLEEISVSPQSETYKVDGNCLIRKEDGCLVLCGRKVNAIPDYVKKIGNYAFFGRKLTQIDLPGGLTEIGNYAFYNNRFTQITLPDGVEKIGSYAFYNNDFSQITLPENLKEIGSYAFKSCEKLKSIAIPGSVETIGSSAFEECHALSVVLPGTVKTIGKNAFDAASIYTSAQKRPEGWKYISGGSAPPIRWEPGNCIVFWGCKFGYDGNQPYVESCEWINDDDRFTIDFSNGDVIKGYIPVPMRSGYKFVGWATEEGSTEVVYAATLVDPATFVYPDYALPEDRYFGEAFYSCLSIKEIALMPSGTTLYAVWQPISE